MIFLAIKVKITREENASFYNVNIGNMVDVDEDFYVAGVVASEIGNSRLEACKAQAVAARTFAACKNWSVTDSSATDQAFRANRANNSLYLNAMLAAEKTSGEILLYNGKPISAVYSACNGGRTISAKERWGSERAYLKAFDDQWDDSEKRTGHGVGMSQRGAKNMAAAGLKYQEILAYYYPGTDLIKMADDPSPQINGGTKMVTAEQFLEKVKIPLDEKWGYIYGTAGKMWTQELQNRMNKTTEEKYTKSRKYGKKWIGHMVTDCSGLVYWALLELGEKTTHHAWYLYTDFCTAKGQLKGGKRDDGQDILPGTLVFIKGSKEHIHHVGVYIGDGTVVEAKGVEYGVVTSPLSKWEFWGELKCVDYFNHQIQVEVPGVMKARVVITGQWLNVRTNGGKQYPMVFKLNNGDVVDVLDSSNKNWWQIRYGGRVGWASTKYLVAENGVEEEDLPFEEETKVDHKEIDNMIQLMRASINALYDEIDKLQELLSKL